MNKRIAIIAACLLLTLGARAWVSRTPALPPREALSQFPATVKSWNRVADDELSASVQAVLRADDYLSRRYRDDQGHFADLFIAYYQTQRAGETMHSPKNCLPGAGWQPVTNDTVMMETSNGKVEINRYVIEKSGSKALVLYWYQAGGRVIASEYWGKFYLVVDAMRTGRRDGGIVRVFIPIGRNEDPNAYLPTALAFAQSLTSDIPRFLPN